MARSALAQATSFAHLLGLGGGGRNAAAPRAADDDDDDERKQRDGESDEDYKDRMDKLDDKEKNAKADEDDKGGKKKPDGKKSKAADGDDDDGDDDDERKQRDGESDEDYEDRMDKLDDKEKANARRARRAAEDGDDADAADDADAKTAAARGRERARCAAIFASPAAAKRPDVAAHLAFGTNLTRTAAIDTLKAVAAGERVPVPAPAAGLRSRMATQPAYDVGTEGERRPATGPQAFAARMLQADKKRRGIA